MFTQEFFYPDQIVPPSEFISAMVEFCCLTVAHVEVEINAVPGHVGVLSFRDSDTGVEVQNVLGADGILQSLVETAAQADFKGVLPEVDGSFRRPVAGRAADEGMGVGVAQNLAAALRYEVRVTL